MNDYSQYTAQYTIALTRKKMKSDLRQGIICAICVIFCFLSIKTLWVFAIVFGLCSAFRFYHYVKLKHNTIKMEKVLDEFEEADNISAPKRKQDISKKERKVQYKSFLKELNEEFDMGEDELSDFDDDEYEYDDD